MHIRPEHHAEKHTPKLEQNGDSKQVEYDTALQFDVTQRAEMKKTIPQGISALNANGDLERPRRTTNHHGCPVLVDRSKHHAEKKHAV